MKKKKERVKKWYDGFTFGNYTDIYNPWSIINFLDTGRIESYWANTSNNSLISKLLQRGDRQLKISFEQLLKGESIKSSIDEQIVYDQLDGSVEAIWSLFLASGYLKVTNYEEADEEEMRWEPLYELVLTNNEVRQTFYRIIRRWFTPAEADYNDFVKALLQNDVRAMNIYMNRISSQCFSFFDTGKGL